MRLSGAFRLSSSIDFQIRRWNLKSANAAPQRNLISVHAERRHVESTSSSRRIYDTQDIAMEAAMARRLAVIGARLFDEPVLSLEASG